MIGNKTADKITKVSKNSPQNSSEVAINELENIEIAKEINIYILRKKTANSW